MKIVKRQTNFQAGFSLIEVIISIVLLSFLVLAMNSITSDNIDTKDRVLTEDRQYIQVQAAMERMGQDIAEIYSPLYFSARKLKSESNQSEEDDTQLKFSASKNFPEISHSAIPVPLFENPEKSEIVFMTMANRRKMQDSKQSRVAWIRYSLTAPEKKVEGITGENLTRNIFSSDPYIEEHDWSKSRNQLLLKNVTSLKFFFWNQTKKEYVASINELDLDERYVIRSIKIELEWVDKDKNKNTIIRSFRPHWPYFDVVKDQMKKDAAAKGNNTGSNKGDTKELESKDDV